MDPTNMLPNQRELNNLKRESNNFEGDNVRELKDDFEIYNSKKN